MPFLWVCNDRLLDSPAQPPFCAQDFPQQGQGAKDLYLSSQLTPEPHSLAEKGILGV